MQMKKKKVIKILSKLKGLELDNVKRSLRESNSPKLNKTCLGLLASLFKTTIYLNRTNNNIIIEYEMSNT